MRGRVSRRCTSRLVAQRRTEVRARASFSTSRLTLARVRRVRLIRTISGGCDNLGGAGTLPSNTCSGSGLETISGGLQNTASGHYSTVGGGGSTCPAGGDPGVE
jgi:hypothetical protein